MLCGQCMIVKEVQCNEQCEKAHLLAVDPSPPAVVRKIDDLLLEL